MKKLVLALALALALALTLIGCSDNEETSYRFVNEKTSYRFVNEKTSYRFVKVYQLSSNSIYVDSETGVMYYWHSGGYSGGLTVMVDENGKPLIWEGSVAE